MKPSWLPILLSVLASSLLTAGAIELLRSPLATREPGEASRPPAVHAARPAGPADAVLDPSGAEPGHTELLARLERLERRLKSLEATRTERVAVAPAAPRPRLEELDEGEQEQMRLLVLDWVGQDRRDRHREAEQREQEAVRSELQFEARHRAREIARDFDLPSWQEERFRELFLETSLRAHELEETIDFARDSPEDVERRWHEFELWVEQRERELAAEIDPDLYEEMYGDEDEDEEEEEEYED